MIVLCVLVEFEHNQPNIKFNKRFLRFYTDTAFLKKSFSKDEIKKQLIDSLINSEKSKQKT